MIDGTFKLEPEASLAIAGFSFPAFSGDGLFRNRRTHMCLPNQGPIPVGTYFILDRQSGGHLGEIHRLIKGDWFALFADDRVIDDERYCAGLLRGQFRLHAKGPRGLSQGCITLDRQYDFDLLCQVLKMTEVQNIPGTTYKAYGRIRVS